jgi:hypothetical protein
VICTEKIKKGYLFTMTCKVKGEKTGGPTVKTPFFPGGRKEAKMGQTTLV